MWHFCDKQYNCFEFGELMSAVNNNKAHYKTIRQTCLIANIAYIILRIFYAVLFIVTKTYIMLWVDLASILIYILCFFVIKKKKYYLYALLCGNEYLAFIIVGTLMLGFSTGFHFYLIGLSIVSFFTSYFSKAKNVKNPIIWASLSLIIYFVIYLVSCFNAPYYQIDKWLEITLMCTHIVMVFLFVCFYLIIFVKYALSLEKKIMSESRTDELTQINNRYGLYDYFAIEDDMSNKLLALFDIDDFKLINDKNGHVTGDFILKGVARIITEVLNGSFYCRYGGEEFIAVVNKDLGESQLEELRKRIEEENFEYEGRSFKITITIGASAYKKDISLEKWIELADEKMYQGKNSGKNKVVV